MLPWDDHATGAGHVQGTAAVAATPLGPLVAARLAPRDRSTTSKSGSFSVRISSAVGRIPVEFTLRNGSAGSDYRATVFDPSGRLVKRWNEANRRGSLEAWDGRTADGSAARSGVYFLRVESGDQAAVAKVVLSR